jgi:hypothetical protein
MVCVDIFNGHDFLARQFTTAFLKNSIKKELHRKPCLYGYPSPPPPPFCLSCNIVSGTEEFVGISLKVLRAFCTKTHPPSSRFLKIGAMSYVTYGRKWVYTSNFHLSRPKNVKFTVGNLNIILLKFTSYVKVGLLKCVLWLRA